MELVLRVNLGPLDVLEWTYKWSSGLRQALQKEDRISQLTVSKKVHKSAAIATFQTNIENKSRFPKFFWFEGFESDVN